MHEWVPVVEKPLKCPACNQPKYWLPKVRNVEGKSTAVRQTETRGAERVGGRSVAEKLSPVTHGRQDAEVGDGETVYEKDDWSQI